MPTNGENIPEWLKSLQGESPLLSDAEWSFIAGIRSRIMDEIKSEERISSECDGGHLKHKLSVMKDNFKFVVEHLKTNCRHRQYFIDVYSKWSLLRAINIRQLQNIALSIEDTRKKCQTANFIGSCVSLIGGGISLLAASPLAELNGSAMVGIGTLASAGSSMAEVGLLHSKIKEAEKVLQEDKESSEHLWKWLSDSSYLQKAVDRIRYIDVEMNLKFVSNTIRNAFKKKRNKSELEKLIKEVMSSFHVSPALAEDISDVIGIFVAISMLYDRYRPLFDLAFAGYKSSVQLRTSVDLFRAALAVTFGARKTGRTEASEKKLAVGMVLDVISIGLVCKDFNSKSKQAKMVTKAASMLEEEAGVFERLYTEIKDLDVGAA